MSQSKRLALLQQPPFAIYLIGQFFSAVGNGCGYIAMSWVVISRHPSVIAMSILLGCFWGPSILLGPVMGVLADRFSRKWLLMLSNIVRAMIFIAFSIYLTEHFQVSVVYTMMLCVGASFSLFIATVFGFLRELIAPDDLMYANNLIDITYEVGNSIGLGIAGFMIAWVSAPSVIFINGLAFVIAVACMFFIPKSALRYQTKTEKRKMHVLKDMRDGFTYVFYNKKLVVIYTVQLLIFISYLTTPLLLLPFCKMVLHADARQFGIIESCASIGIVIGGLFMPWISDRVGLFKTVLIFSLVLLFSFLVFGFNHVIIIAAILYFIIGFSGAIWPLVISRAQSLTHLDFQGRVQSTFNSFSGVLMMLFYFLVGAIGNYVGVAYLYSLEVVVMIIAVVFLFKGKTIFQVHNSQES